MNKREVEALQRIIKQIGGLTKEFYKDLELIKKYLVSYGVKIED